MKKVILVGAIALLGLTSCNKDYTCTCTSTFNDNSKLVQSFEFKSTTQDEAKTNCEAKAKQIYADNSVSGFESKVDWVSVAK